MSQVFISYRQTDAEQSQRVRAFAERLRDAGINVILDQFFLDDHPAGPNEGWPQWSSDRALETAYVVIIGSDAWFECFEKKQPPGTGLGAAREAHDIRQRIYDNGGVIHDIRLVLFEQLDAEFIPGQLRGYHWFHAERDFANIVRWLGGTLPTDTPHTSIPHNLPALQPFFGREEELRKIAYALDSETRTWGLVINGPAGMGKTSLAVRAAYDAPSHAFEKIVFVSLKAREMDDDGVRDLSDFLISGLAELLNELARELDHAEIVKSPENQRPSMLLDVLRGTNTLLVLDNLESLLKRERHTVLTFVNRLPVGCKAILTSRERIGSGGEELILQELSESAALATLAKLAEGNPTLAKTSNADRRILYRETTGKPILLRWTAGQIGRGSCVTLSDAIAYLRSCPDGNDPLEFIFGDLIEDFSTAETHVLCALTYFRLPAKAEHIAELALCPDGNSDVALRSLINRSLVLPSEDLKTFSLVPLVADFLRKEKFDVILEVGERLENYVYTLVIGHGGKQFERFPVIEGAWPTIAAALPRFIAGTSERLQNVCEALFRVCTYNGRYDELLALNKDAETRAVSAMDFSNAGWRSYQVGWIHSLRGQVTEVLECADRAESHWLKANAGIRELAIALNLRGVGHELAKNYVAAISAYREVVEHIRNSGDDRDLATSLNALAGAESASGNIDDAERDFAEALRIARARDYKDGIATYTDNLSDVALERKDWSKAEALAREALPWAEKVGRKDLIASVYYHIAKSLVGQGKKNEAIKYAHDAAELFDRVGSPEQLAYARKVIAECES